MAPNGSGSGGWSDGAGDLSWKRFLDGGSQGVSEAAVLDEGRRVKLSWVDGHESEYSLIWLRDNSDGSFHAITRQREVGYFFILEHTTYPTRPKQRKGALSHASTEDE